MAFGPMGTGKDGEFTFLTDNTLSQMNIPADAQAAGKLLAALLERSGGTMTGNMTFADIGDTATSMGLKWSGSTDGASIFYQTTAKDQGNLVLNLKDDSNCYLRIAKNGTFKSYFSPDDGNFHGNVNGKADTAGTADTGNSVAWANVTGVPTIPKGAITASGDNYIRFADGTQICWTKGSNSAGRRKVNEVYTWPVPFMSPTGAYETMADIYTTDPCVNMTLTPTSASHYYKAADPGEYVLAIGKWK